jgi:RHS repeat-associated protein
LTRPNGVNTNYAYDSVSHLLSVLHQAGSTTLDGAGYGYDFAGNRTSKANYLNGITSNYGYDAIYELQQVTQGGSTTESYSYDAVGNRLSSLGMNPYSYNSSNELTSNSSGSYTYDANGNTLSDPSGKSYTWDFENRLTHAVNPGVGTTTFKYDPFGRRIQKISPSFTSVFVYDGSNLIETLNASGAEVASYTQTRTIDETLAELRSGTTDYYEADGLGSTTSLSASSGTLGNTYAYDSFGNLTASTGTVRNYFQYTGREFDPETGIYEYRARYFDPSSGRFLSEDPLKFGAGVDFYAYVKNRPLNYKDPLGLSGICWSCIADTAKSAWDKTKDAADNATALFQCYLCIVTSIGNTQSRAGAPLFNNGDLSMQGTDYPGAPSASMGYMEARKSCTQNTNCPECAKAGISTAVGGMTGQ